MDLIFNNFLITMILAVACAVLCFIKDKSAKTKMAIILTGTTCYVTACFLCGLVVGYCQCI